MSGVDGLYRLALIPPAWDDALQRVFRYKNKAKPYMPVALLATIDLGARWRSRGT